MKRNRAWVLDFGADLQAAVAEREMLHLLASAELYDVPATPFHFRQVVIWNRALLPGHVVVRPAAPKPYAVVVVGTDLGAEGKGSPAENLIGIVQDRIGEGGEDLATGPVRGATGPFHYVVDRHRHRADQKSQPGNGHDLKEST